MKIDTRHENIRKIHATGVHQPKGKSALWQWDKGFKIGDGDFVDFDTTNFHTISHDTIFKKGIPKCIIIETNKENYLMKVKSLTGEIGYYDDSEQFTK